MGRCFIHKKIESVYFINFTEMITIEDMINYSRWELIEEPYFIALINTLRINNVVSYVDVGANVGEFSKSYVPPP